ncbi:MAG: UDP-2,3-diacylglucosamine diphosphatase [Prolixibacteraceae bacterium]|nr:UDP-2,3-diacylglucosamine diphosphatase [Prolixibacteraceae bacterium]
MAKQEKKIYFVSDVHLGALSLDNMQEREKIFSHWLEKIRKDAGMLFLMGDIFDFWFDYKSVIPRGFTRTLGKIAEIADDGIPVHFFTGNHDLWVFDYMSSELGVQVHHKECMMTLYGKKFFLVHGDGLDAGDKKYLFLKKIFTNKVLQKLFSMLHPNLSFAIAHAWSKKSRLTKGVDSFRENDGIYEYAKALSKKESFEYFVVGHRHLMINRLLENKAHFIILGNWITYNSYGVFDGETFELKRYKE